MCKRATGSGQDSPAEKDEPTRDYPAEKSPAMRGASRGTESFSIGLTQLSGMHRTARPKTSTRNAAAGLTITQRA